MLKPDHFRILGDYDEHSLFIKDFEYDNQQKRATAKFQINSCLYSREIDHFTSPQMQLCLNQGLYLLAYERGMLKRLFAQAEHEGQRIHEVCKAVIRRQYVRFRKPIPPPGPITCVFSNIKEPDRVPDGMRLLKTHFAFAGGACTGDVTAVLRFD